MDKPWRIISFFVPHQGCPHTCVFCNQKSISGKSLPPTETEVAERLRECRATIPAGYAVEAAFYGGSFTGLSAGEREVLLTPAYAACQEGLLDGIRVSARPDQIDTAVLKHLKKYGVRTVELGAQSLDPDVLIASGRGHTPEDTRRSSRLIQDAGLRLGLQMMIGLPRDTREKSRATGQEIGALGPDFVRIYPTLVMRRTLLHKLYLAGFYSPLTLAEAIDWSEWLYLNFCRRKISVIRMGLQATDSLLKPGEIIAGPFHPAFGELVESAAAFRQIEYLLARRKVGAAMHWPRRREPPEQWDGHTRPAAVKPGRVRPADGQAGRVKLADGGSGDVKPSAGRPGPAIPADGIAGNVTSSQAVIAGNPRYLSRLIGQHRANLRKIEQSWQQPLKIIGDESIPGRDLWLKDGADKTTENYLSWQEFLTNCRMS